MDFGFLSDYLVILVIGICACAGYMLKNLIPTDKINKYIPLIMGTLGIVLNLWVNSWTVSPEIILGGMASGLASTGSYELIKNLFMKGDK